ncbi:unnamed protein product, partial [Chrysoparadoxa australica]
MQVAHYEKHYQAVCSRATIRNFGTTVQQSQLPDVREGFGHILQATPQVLKGYPALQGYFRDTIWKDKKMWAFCYGWTCFTLGMNATQRVESMFNALKKWIDRRKKTLVELIRELKKMQVAADYETFFCGVLGDIGTPYVCDRLKVEMQRSYLHQVSHTAPLKQALLWGTSLPVPAGVHLAVPAAHDPETPLLRCTSNIRKVALQDIAKAFGGAQRLTEVFGGDEAKVVVLNRQDQQIPGGLGVAVIVGARGEVWMCSCMEGLQHGLLCQHVFTVHRVYQRPPGTELGLCPPPVLDAKAVHARWWRHGVLPNHMRIPLTEQDFVHCKLGMHLQRVSSGEREGGAFGCDVSDIREEARATLEEAALKSQYLAQVKELWDEAFEILADPKGSLKGEEQLTLAKYVNEMMQQHKADSTRVGPLAVVGTVAARADNGRRGTMRHRYRGVDELVSGKRKRGKSGAKKNNVH